MNTATRLCAALLLAAPFASPAIAQVDDGMKSYNYQMALEFANNGKFRTAAERLEAELKDHPQNAAAYYLYGTIYENNDMYDKAGEYYATAIMLSESEPKSEIYSRSVTAYAMLLYDEQNQDAQIQAEALLDEAVKKAPTSTLLLYQGWFATRNSNNVKAEKCYRAAIKANKKEDAWPDDLLYGQYLIPSLLAQGKLADAEKALADVEKAEPDGEYSKLAKVALLDIKGRDDEAIDLLLNLAFRIPSGKTGALRDSKSFNADWKDKLTDLAYKNYDLVISKMEQFAKSPDASEVTLFYASRVANNRCKFQDYIRLAKADDPDYFPSDPIAANAYYYLYANNQAIEIYDRAIETNSTDRADYANFLRTRKAECMARLGDIDGAEALLDSLAAASPSCSDAYHIHAKILSDYSSRLADAVAYADTALAIVGKNSYKGALIAKQRMLCNESLGNHDAAVADAKAIIAYEDSKKTSSLFSCYKLHDKSAVRFLSNAAYAILGQKDAAIQSINECLDPKADLDVPAFVRFLYAATTYSILDMPDETLNYLEKALQTGYRDFISIEGNPIFANIRDRKEFTSLLDTYRDKYRHISPKSNNPPQAIEKYISTPQPRKNEKYILPPRRRAHFAPRRNLSTSLRCGLAQPLREGALWAFRSSHWSVRLVGFLFPPAWLPES